MKVAVVVPTLEQAESWGGWLALGFQALGHEAKAFPYRDVAESMHGDRHAMNRTLLRNLRKWDSELVVVVKGEMILPETVATLDKRGFRIVLLANDDHQVWKQVSLPLGRQCERVFTFTKGALPWYEAEGVKAEHMLFYADPKACAADGMMPPLYDVSFVGTYYPEREGLVTALINSAARGEMRFRLLGDGWEKVLGDATAGIGGSRPAWTYGGRPDYSEVLRTWHSSKVCLNIHQTGLKRLGVVANLRCYELGAAGRFMATDYVQDMHEAFGEHLPFKILAEQWTDREKVDRLKTFAEPDYSETRTEKAIELRNIVLARHTPEKRALQILESVYGAGWSIGKP